VVDCAGSAAFFSFNEPARIEALKFAKSLASARMTARLDNMPLALYFCTPEAAEFSGEGAEAIAQYRSMHGGKAPPLTPFDSSLVTGMMRNMGIGLFVKVPLCAATAESFSEYSATPGTLILCAPDGDALAEYKDSKWERGKLIAMIVIFKGKFERWKLKHPQPTDPELEKVESGDE
jgi:hypothetical protein